MPQLTKKRKAAVLRWVSRKRTVSSSVLDSIRSSAQPAGIDLAEIGQPVERNEDTPFDCIPGPSSSAPVEDSDPSSPVAMPTIFEQQFCSSVAELPIMDFDTMPLPELRYDDIFATETDWSMLDAGNVHPTRDKYTAELPKGSLTANTSAFSPKQSISKQLSAAISVAVDHEPRSPLLAVAEREDELERTSLLHQVYSSEFGDAKCSIANYNTTSSNLSWDNDRTNLSPHRSIDVSNRSELDRSSCCFGDTSNPTPSAVTEPSMSLPDSNVTAAEFSNDDLNDRYIDNEASWISRHLKLTRSKTIMIDIPGRPPDVHKLEDLDCYCTACIECAEFKLKRQTQDSINNRSQHNLHDDDVVKRKMQEIYEKFELPTGANDRSFSHTPSKGPHKSATEKR
ncbi:AAEL004556-PA [Aedes aegypti]|uniref:AAEL004556-PA n=1 Tax=Aedes aegypti TaxID=7159 RepID=Q17CK6_AEDAE|nr:AAEL004556-PA [Aedes aegypti]